MYDDIVFVDKLAGWTSFDVVAKIRGSIRTVYREHGVTPTKRQQKVGHAGTLDPFATGLLVVLIGGTCSRASEFLKLDKTYETTVRLGAVSSTGDSDGRITETNIDHAPELEDVERVIVKFRGTINQVPPIYSAIKVNGERAYKRARKGEDITMPVRSVTIHTLEIIDYAYPELTLRAHVSSGTYIRSLAEDIGKVLGTGAYCQELRRTHIGEWSIDQAQTVEDVISTIGQSVRSVLRSQ